MEKTSYNTHGNKHTSGDNSKAFRGNYAGVGMIYDEDNDMFLPQKPYSSWVLNTAKAKWESPIGDEPAMTDEQQAQNGAGTHHWFYNWDEDSQSWALTDHKA